MVSIVIKVQRWENTLGTNWPNVLPTKNSRFEQLWCADTSRADLRTRIKESPSWWRGTGRSSSDGRRVDRSFAAGSSFHPDSRLPGLGLNPPREEGEDHHGQPHRLRPGSQLHLHVQLRAGNSWRFAFSAAVILSLKKLGAKWVCEGCEGMTASPTQTIVSERHLQGDGRIGARQKTSKSFETSWVFSDFLCRLSSTWSATFLPNNCKHCFQVNPHCLRIKLVFSFRKKKEKRWNFSCATQEKRVHNAHYLRTQRNESVHQNWFYVLGHHWLHWSLHNMKFVSCKLFIQRLNQHPQLSYFLPISILYFWT